MKAKINLVNIKSYIVGNYRYRLYGTEFQWLIRTHILEQIKWRISVMDKGCYENGSCFICGCATTALQMANKNCDKPCYPCMMPKDKWKLFKRGGIFFDYPTKIFWQIVDGSLIKFNTATERKNELEQNTH